jgi:exonuclease III
VNNFIKLKGLKIIHQNIQSLRLKINELKIVICTSLRDGLHILTLSETWLTKSILDSEIAIPGYTLSRLDRGKNGGVAVYARNELSFVRRDDLELEGVEGLYRVYKKN